ncbi:hypothetical protein BON30_11640 [Cystobacter ferrugineus]|uniref:Uncharacterized protein n=1 Tax=Cystobacter ferrugineus TaxID=83449 RepID=A0A1L9BH40_9BACT|nr:hypothetical protein BON30_11640 [Cystobacter ferrugineus]
MKLVALITVVAMACVGCAHVQRPESRIYVVSKNADGLGAALATLVAMIANKSTWSACNAAGMTAIRGHTAKSRAVGVTKGA